MFQKKGYTQIEINDTLLKVSKKYNKIKNQFWKDVGTRIIIIGLLLFLSTILFLLRFISSTKINYIFITIPLFLILILSLESNVKFYNYINFFIGWTWRLSIVSLFLYLIFIIKSLQYSQMSIAAMNIPLYLLSTVLMVGACCGIFGCSIYCNKDKKEVLKISLFLIIITLVTIPSFFMLGIKYAGVIKNYARLSYCLIPFFVGDGLSIIFIFYCWFIIIQNNTKPILYKNQIYLLLSISFCSIIFKSLLSRIVDNGINDFIVLLIPAICGEVFIISLGINLRVSKKPNFANFEKVFLLEIQKTSNDIIDYKNANIKLIKSITNKHMVDYLGTFAHWKPNLNEFDDCNFVGDILFFKVWRNKVTRNIIFQQLEIYKYYYNISFNSPEKLLHYRKRSYLSKIKLDFNKTIHQGVIPDCVDHIIFGDTFNMDLQFGSIPLSVRYIEFGSSFDKSFYLFSRLNNLKYLKFNNGNINLENGSIPPSVTCLDLLNSNYNRKIKKGFIPDSVQYLLLPFSFSQKIEQGSIPSVKMLFIGGNLYRLNK